ncbi:MAG: hypothetical protein UHS54_06570 [Lachnospiraceae bacterium]|nr:hypothetical protein [Lachnospiraceae bacterium]
METVINKLAEIEIGATKILENANAEKITLAKELDEQILAFDRETDTRTAEKLQSIKENYRMEMEKNLADLKTQTDQTLSNMENTFRTQHDAMSDAIVKQILK